MSSLRRLQRGVIRNRCRRNTGSTKSFKEEWDRIHYSKIDADGNTVVVDTRKPKKRHEDSGRLIIQRLKAMKAIIAEKLKAGKTEKTASVTK